MKWTNKQVALRSFCIVLLGLGVGLLLFSACAGPPTYTWQKPGVTGKDAFVILKQCDEEAKTQPGYLDAQRRANDLPIQEVLDPKKRRDPSGFNKILRAPQEFMWKYESECMPKKGFSYKEWTSPEQGYEVTPELPKKWEKSGVSSDDARDAWKKCQDAAYDSKINPYIRTRNEQIEMNLPYGQVIKNPRTLYEDECMTKQGFVYQ